jgi:hypothetical protein
LRRKSAIMARPHVAVGPRRRAVRPWAECHAKRPRDKV